MKDRKLLNIELGRISAEEYKDMPESGLVVVLDNVRSAYNVGSAFRSCDAFKVDRLLLCGICACPPSPDIHKSGLGAELSLPWKHYESTLEAVEYLKKEGYTIVSIEQTTASVKLDKFRRSESVRYALVFGNEVDGVQQEVVEESDFALEIPQYGTKHSLNISVAVGIILWQFVGR